MDAPVGYHTTGLFLDHSFGHAQHAGQPTRIPTQAPAFSQRIRQLDHGHEMIDTPYETFRPRFPWLPTNRFAGVSFPKI